MKRSSRVPSARSIRSMFMAALLLLVPVALFFGGSAIRAQSFEGPKGAKLPFKSAIIEYQLTGSTTGTKTAYYQGNKLCEETKAKTQMFGVTQEEHKLTIIDGDWMYRVDLVARKATKMKSPQKMVSEMTPEEKKDMEKMGRDMAVQMTGKSPEEMGKPVGKDKVAGQECDVFEVNMGGGGLGGGKTCMWAKSVVLKSDTEIMGMKQSEVAVKIQENVSIPDSRFQVPPGIPIQEQTVGFPGGKLPAASGAGGPSGTGGEPADMKKMMEEMKKLRAPQGTPGKTE